MKKKLSVEFRGVQKTVTIRTRKKGSWGWWLWFYPGADMDRVHIALGRSIWIPASGEFTTHPLMMSEEMLVHELEHLHQQRFSYMRALYTFVRYWLDKRFRYETELGAFQEQYRWVVRNGKLSFKQLYTYRMALAETLSSELYGFVATKDQAFEALGQKA